MIDELDRPWVPASAPVFRIGDRVRINLSPECRCWKETGLGQIRHECQGLTGTITNTTNLPGFPEWGDHSLCVDFDTPIFCATGSRWVAGQFLPIELELIP